MKTILLSLFFVSIYFMAVAQIKCTVKGRLINYPDCKKIEIFKADADYSSGERVAVEVKNGQFEVTFETEYSQIYEVVIEVMPSAWQRTPFCAINGTVEIQIDKKDRNNSFVIGGEENEYINAKKRYITQLYETYSMKEISEKMGHFRGDKRYSVAGLQFWKDFDEGRNGIEKDKLYRKKDVMEKSGEMYVTGYNKLMAQRDSVGALITNDGNEYDKKNPSLHEFSILKSNLSSFEYFKERYKGDDCPLKYLEKRLTSFSKAYSKHPYTAQSKELLKAISRIEAGKYIDFTAPNLDGELVKLSSEIKGKIAIIDLWASWCGPCRRKSISYIPIYEEYKDKGFTIVGVAKEFKNDKAMRQAIKNDTYKWTNLIELDGKNGIWEKYGVANGAGATFLVDKNGRILAKDPTADEVREILEEKLSR